MSCNISEVIGAVLNLLFFLQNDFAHTKRTKGTKRTKSTKGTKKKQKALKGTTTPRQKHKNANKRNK